MLKVRVRAPAKLNLALAVTGVRLDGYHMVDMVMQAISLYEYVEISKSMGYSLRLPKSPVPSDDKNTATKAAAAFFWHTGLLAGADIIVHKSVPTRAGLAGGSADAAAVLVGLNELYGAQLSINELCEIGATVGADVPFSLLGGTARVSGIGDILQPLPDLPHCFFCIAMPKTGVSTPAAYLRFDKMGSPLRPDITAACSAIKNAELASLAPHMQNMLQHANGDELTARLCHTFRTEGALASLMTGSGAAVFGLFTDENAAKNAQRVIDEMSVQTFLVQPVAHGPQVVE